MLRTVGSGAVEGMLKRSRRFMGVPFIGVARGVWRGVWWRNRRGRRA